MFKIQLGQNKLIAFDFLKASKLKYRNESGLFDTKRLYILQIYKLWIEYVNFDKER